MSRTAQRGLALSLGLLVLALGGVAGAVPCGRPDVDATFPPDQATSVPTNAILTAHYSAPALYIDEQVTLRDSAGNDVSVSSSFDEADAVMRAVPDAPLADGNYTAEWPTLRGLSEGGIGLGKKIKFAVMGVTDTTPPTFAGLTDIDWDLTRDKDPCLDGLHDRFVFKLKVGAAADDAGTSLLAIQVFQTKDPLNPDQTGPNRVALSSWSEGGTIEVRRPANKAGDTCFAAIAQDLVGSVSGGGEREVCIKTQKAPFFDGCNVRAPGSSSGALWLLLAALGLGLRGRGRLVRLASNRPA